MHTLFRIAVLFALTLPGLAAAQRMEPTKDCEVGDRSTSAWTLNAKTQQIEEECTAVNGQEVRFTQKLADRTYEAAVTAKSAHLIAVMCIANGQPCTFSPPLDFAGFPLEKGKKWAPAFTVKGETFTAEVTQERKAEKLEKVKVPAGEFDAFRISFSGRIQGMDAKGARFTGKEDGTDWIALVNGKPVVVKTVYRNSFGEKASRELTSIAFK
jgi:hypothetical protein